MLTVTGVSKDSHIGETFLLQATLTQLNYSCDLLLIQVIGENVKELNYSG